MKQKYFKRFKFIAQMIHCKFAGHVFEQTSDPYRQFRIVDKCKRCGIISIAP